jgi:hypothetical protein
MRSFPYRRLKIRREWFLVCQKIVLTSVRLLGTGILFMGFNAPFAKKTRA